MAVCSRGDKASASLNGRMFIIGGEQKNSPTNCTYSVPVYDVESYHPTDNAWEDEHPILGTVFHSTSYIVEFHALVISEPKFRFDAETLFGNVYIFGGQIRKSENVHVVSDTYEVLLLSPPAVTRSPSPISIATLPLSTLLDFSYYLRCPSLILHRRPLLSSHSNLPLSPFYTCSHIGYRFIGSHPEVLCLCLQSFLGFPGSGPSPPFPSPFHYLNPLLFCFFQLRVNLLVFSTLEGRTRVEHAANFDKNNTLRDIFI